MEDMLRYLTFDVVDMILAYLPNRDIKNLRLTSAFFRDVAKLRLTRVFLSPNPRNIQVFREVADHDVFRRQIVEIIYDDARLESRGAESASDDDDDEDDDDYEYDDVLATSVSGRPPFWFSRRYDELVERLENYKGYFVQRPDHVEVARKLEARLSAAQSYMHYQALLQQQHQIITAGDDGRALEYGLLRFPNLRRLTLTPVAHGLVPFVPRYETPMIRSLPAGFIYPPPRGWTVQADDSNKPDAGPWDSQDEKNKWHGFCVVADTLARNQAEFVLNELVIDVNQLLTGLSCRIFDDPSPEYNNFVTILQAPNFTRLDLALFVGGQDVEDWHAFRSTLLQRALAGARDLEHMSLATSLKPPVDAESPEFFGADKLKHFVPLRTIFPVDTWTRLRHFGLSRFMVKQDDLVDLLSALPPTLRSVELSFLFFFKSAGDYRGLLGDLRDTLGWRAKPIREQPEITLLIENEPVEPGFSIDVSQDVNAFVYQDGANPFGLGDENGGCTVFRGEGFGIQRDAFQPANDRPYAHDMALMDLGIVEKDDWYRRGIRF